MILLNSIQRKERDKEDLAINDEFITILKTQFLNKELHIKYTIDKKVVKINEFFEDNSLMLSTDPEFNPGETIIIYGLLKKYFEIELKVEERRGPGYFKCRINWVNRAKNVREHLRLRLSSNMVVATNFRVSKHSIDVSQYKIPTSVKVILDQFQSKYSDLSDIVKINVLDYGDIIFNKIKKTKKTLYIEDVSNPESYKAFTDDFLDLTEILGDELDEYIKINVEKGYKSIIISPVIYITDENNSIPFAFIQLISKRENYAIDKVLEVKELSFNLVDRIRDSNTLLLQVHQSIVDISLSGAKLKISEENLKKYLLHSKGFIFDILFKLQAPITIYGEIKSTYYDNKGNMYVGIDFAGNSSREDEMKRFKSLLDPMIKEYKAEILKTMNKK